MEPLCLSSKLFLIVIVLGILPPSYRLTDLVKESIKCSGIYEYLIA